MNNNINMLIYHEAVCPNTLVHFTLSVRTLLSSSSSMLSSFWEIE